MKKALSLILAAVMMLCLCSCTVKLSTTNVIPSEIVPENNSGELYFEESDIEGFVRKLESYYPEVRYVNRLMTHSWGQRVIRFYDPDGNLIEVGTPI